jgi:hypothetical protein
VLAPWASRRRRDLLELMDRLTPTIAELTQAIEQEMADIVELRDTSAAVAEGGSMRGVLDEREP